MKAILSPALTPKYSTASAASLMVEVVAVGLAPMAIEQILVGGRE
jgi:hypothetical protein